MIKTLRLVLDSSSLSRGSSSSRMGRRRLYVVASVDASIIIVAVGGAIPNKTKDRIHRGGVVIVVFGRDIHGPSRQVMTGWIAIQRRDSIVSRRHAIVRTIQQTQSLVVVVAVAAVVTAID